jgi:hypothetical protein
MYALRIILSPVAALFFQTAPQIEQLATRCAVFLVYVVVFVDRSSLVVHYYSAPLVIFAWLFLL